MGAPLPSYDIPESMRSVVEAIGHSATLSLIHVYGGTTVWIPLPCDLREGHPLVGLLGGPCTAKLCRAVGGLRLQVPLAAVITLQARDVRIMVRWRSGATISTIAREFGLTRKSVYASLARSRARRKSAELHNPTGAAPIA